MGRIRQGKGRRQGGLEAAGVWELAEAELGVVVAAMSVEEWRVLGAEQKSRCAGLQLGRLAGSLLLPEAPDIAAAVEGLVVQHVETGETMAELLQQQAVLVEAAKAELSHNARE